MASSKMGGSVKTSRRNVQLNPRGSEKDDDTLILGAGDRTFFESHLGVSVAVLFF